VAGDTIVPSVLHPALSRDGRIFFYLFGEYKYQFTK